MKPESTSTAAQAANVSHVLAHWERKVGAADAFRESARFLGGMELSEGFPEQGSISTFARGYAVVYWSPGELYDAATPGGLLGLVIGRMDAAARCLGKLFTRHLRGEGKDRLFEDAYRDALEQGIGYAVSGLGVAKLGDVLEHVGDLPHLIDDDGRRVLRLEHVDGLQARLRLIARVVAPA